jgi:hypothetical protein
MEAWREALTFSGQSPGLKHFARNLDSPNLISPRNPEYRKEMNAMKNLKFVPIISLIVFAVPVQAEEKHPEHDAVMKVVDSFFEAINTSSAELMSEIALLDSMTYSVREQDDGQWTFRARPQTWDLDRSKNRLRPAP